MDSVPAIAKIAELRLGIRAPTDDVRRGSNYKAPFASAFRELWAGSVLWANLSRNDMQALAAFFESRDGRVTPFGVSLAAGFASQYVNGNATVAGTLAATPALGADVVSISASGSPPLLAGTLISFGDPDDAYQVCEVLQDTLADGTSSIYIAPRIRYELDTLDCTLGTVTGKFVLADDTLKALKFVPAYGALSVDVIEAL